ncbi:hypothetical protein ACFFRR_000858 [Megaselia abdita]
MIGIFTALFLIKLVSGFDTNLPYSAFNECKEYRVDGQYVYKDSFNIHGLKNNRPYDNEVFRMKFYVLTDRDANIMISNERKVQNNDNAYEIVIGGWNNTKSTIRKNKFSVEVVEKLGSVLSALYPTEIVISLKQDGELTVILPGYERPYLNFKDTKASAWTYLGFSSWENTPARWFYDCPLGIDGPGGNDINTIFANIDIRVSN